MRRGRPHTRVRAVARGSKERAQVDECVCTKDDRITEKNETLGFVTSPIET